MADDDLSAEQILELLQAAEYRLKISQQNELAIIESPSLPLLQKSIVTVASDQVIPTYIKSAGQGVQIDPSHLARPEERKLSNGIRHVEDPVLVKSQSGKAKKANAGSDWYNLPRTVLTPELKRDLQLLRMRSVLSGGKRHYKKDNSKAKFPEFSQVGTIIEGPTEFFSARLSNKERKRTLVEEVLAGESSNHRFRSKYNEIQAAKTSGKKTHFKRIKEMRRGGGSKG